VGVLDRVYLANKRDGFEPNPFRQSPFPKLELGSPSRHRTLKIGASQWFRKKEI